MFEETWNDLGLNLRFTNFLDRKTQLVWNRIENDVLSRITGYTIAECIPSEIIPL